MKNNNQKNGWIDLVLKKTYFLISEFNYIFTGGKYHWYIIPCYSKYVFGFEQEKKSCRKNYKRCYKWLRI